MKATHRRKRVFWFLGYPPMLPWWQLNMAMMLERKTKHEYTRLSFAPLKVVKLRALFIEKFMAETSDPLDTLVMLDIDHDHPPTIVNDLVAPGSGRYGVHTCLSFRREPTMPHIIAMDYVDGWDNMPAKHVTEFRPGEILEVDRGSAQAMAVQRRVFQAILDLGYNFTQLFEYKGQRDCDEWFARLCSEAGFKHYVNTALVSPHGSDVPTYIGLNDWDKWAKTNGHGGLLSV